MLNSLQIMWRKIEAVDRDAPMAWPSWLRQLALVFVCAAAVGLLWVVNLSVDHQALKRAVVVNDQLRAEFSGKLLHAAPLPSLQNHQSLQRERLALLEKQLPGSREMDLLLSDMSRAGRERNLRFELLRPAELKPQPVYPQQRIALRVIGRYHDLAGFATDLAGLAWLVSIQSFTLRPGQDGVLVMDAVVRTLRPLSMMPSQTTASGAS